MADAAAAPSFLDKSLDELIKETKKARADA